MFELFMQLVSMDVDFFYFCALGLGSIDLDLSSRSLSEPWIEDVWHPLTDLRNKPAGEVHLIIHYVPQVFIIISLVAFGL